MKNAVLYARVSSREQEREGYSIESQQKLIRDYAFRNGIEIVTEFIDVETAKTTGRKQFGEMLAFLKRSKKLCSLVLVEKMDRLSRNFEDFVEIQKTGAEIHFVKTGNSVSKDSKPQMRFMNGIELVSAQYYSDNLREEVKKGMHMKAELGIYPSRAPLGYRNNKIDRTVEIHPENSTVVKRVFELYATGSYSLTLLRKAIRTRPGKPSTVRTFTRSSRTVSISGSLFGAERRTRERTRHSSPSLCSILPRTFCMVATRANTENTRLRFAACSAAPMTIAPSQPN